MYKIKTKLEICKNYESLFPSIDLILKIKYKKKGKLFYSFYYNCYIADIHIRTLTEEDLLKFEEALKLFYNNLDKNIQDEVLEYMEKVNQSKNNDEKLEDIFNDFKNKLNKKKKFIYNPQNNSIEEITK